MTTFAVAISVIGPPAVVAGWLIVRSGRGSLWLVNGVLLPVLAAASLVTGEVRATRGYPFGGAIALGVGAGVVLYAATAVFMAVAGKWPPLARHTDSLYEARSEIPLVSALAISVLLAAPAEELLWRGLILAALDHWFGSLLLAAAFAWLAYVLANAPSGSLPIALGAAVGGAVWTILASTSLGVAASIPCHMVWTGLMLAFPPVPRSR